MAVSINNLFNYSRPLPAPFDTLSNKKVKIGSKYGSTTEATLCCTVVKAVHETYSALLNRLSLASDHRENLLGRGLSSEEIDRLGYRTTPVVGFSSISRQLVSDGLYLAGVPGFYRTEDGKWTFVHQYRRILIPVRDPDGKIQGLQIRRDKVKKGKFRWVSSVGNTDGCKAKCWTHLTGPPRKTVILTEGPMKADIITYLTGQTVLAVPGVNALTELKGSLEYLKANGTEQIMTAFDMDYLANPHVQSGYYELARLLSSCGCRFGTYLWDPEYKGLDDYIWQSCYDSSEK